VAIPSRLRLTPDDKSAIAEFFRFYEPLAPQIVKELRDSLMQLPEWQAVIRAIPPDVEAERNARSIQLQRTAYIDGNWMPYLEDLREQGVTYAKMGVSFIAWYDVIAIYREVIRRRLLALGEADYARATQISTGLNRSVDIAMAHLGEAYLSAKEQIIAEQQAAIRELSLPILHVRDELLVIPIVGMIDTGRARQLIESLLIAIRDRRARGVVLDVTGVPVVDTAVANHLVQATESAKLMGALVVITGISPEMAQTLVTLGARLPAVETHIDLQEGIDQMERALGYRIAEA
jgi:rsbT co-antagonist protein RsbR